MEDNIHLFAVLKAQASIEKIEDMQKENPRLWHLPMLYNLMNRGVQPFVESIEEWLRGELV